MNELESIMWELKTLRLQLSCVRGRLDSRMGAGHRAIVEEFLEVISVECGMRRVSAREGLMILGEKRFNEIQQPFKERIDKLFARDVGQDRGYTFRIKELEAMLPPPEENEP